MSSKSDIVIPLADASAGLSQVGGKGASLARLADAGLPVPSGFTITTTAYRRFVTEHGLQEQILAAVSTAIPDQPDTLEGTSNRIGQLFTQSAMPDEITEEIRQSYEGLGEGDFPVAVRSSATAEDLPEMSFAGQQETYLNVCGSEALLEAVRKCWASLWTTRAIAYRARQGIPPDSVAIAVVVQKMVFSDAAGVMFTADPLTGRRDKIVINAAWGQGEALVSGMVTPDMLIVEKATGRLINRTTSEKQVMTILTETGTRDVPVPENQKNSAVLSDVQAAELVNLGVEIEELFETPMDIEWALAAGKFAILQARLITGLPESVPDDDPFVWNDSLRGGYLWSNVNFGEAVTSVMTPLTWSVLRFTLKDWQYIPGVATFGNIGGYPYLNISVFVSLFHALGRNRQDLMEELEATMYMEITEDMYRQAFPLSGLKLVRSLCSVLWIQLKQIMGVRRTPSYLNTNMDWFQNITGRIRLADSSQALLKLFHEKITAHILQGAWCVLGGATYSANYTIKLRRDLEKLVGREDANILIANTGDANGPLMSLGPVLGLARVAGGEMSKGDYLARYGHRGPDEFELSVPRPAEDSLWFDRRIEQFRRSPADVTALLREQGRAFDQAWQRLQAGYPRKAKTIRRRIAESARRIRIREEARSAYVRDRWSLRLFALRAGELSGLGEDIFFLTLGEILNLLAGDRAAVRYIPSRKSTYHRYQNLPHYPSVIRGAFDPLTETREPSADSTAPVLSLISGSPGSAGRVEGIVRILADPDEEQELQPGEILVTSQADISWTLLFPRAAALITDVGAPLSHAAIVARELGIPAVMGCLDATRRLATGDLVRVDGGLGTVEILGR